MSTLERVACSSHQLALGADGGPPSSFRIFKAGSNPTSKGTFVWDAQAAAQTLAQYKREGVDVQIDLEHDSIDDVARAQRSDAGDARGWCQLEQRNGELWAVNVRWTPDGARRLTEKTQRYISPVIMHDTETGRVVSIYNLALCAVPATYGAQPLVAASRYGAKNSTMIGARVTKETAQTIREYATLRGLAPGQVIRALVVQLAALKYGDPKRIQAANDAIDAGETVKQLQAAIDALEAGDIPTVRRLLGGLLADAPSTAPPPGQADDAASQVQLSARDREEVRKMTPEQAKRFEAARLGRYARKAAQRASTERSQRASAERRRRNGH